MRLHTRAARGGRGRGKGGGRAGQRIPEGSPGWAGEAAWLPHGHCSFRERDAAIPRPCPSGGASSPRLCAPPLRDRFAPFKGPAVCGSDRRASTGQELPCLLPPEGLRSHQPPLRVPRDSQGAPGHRLRIAAGTGRGPAAHPSQGSREERAAPGPQGEPGRDGGTDPAIAARYLRPLPRRAGGCRGDGSTASPGTGLRGSHGHGAVLTASHGEPRPAPSRGGSAAAPAQRRQPRRAFLPRQRPPAPPGTALGHPHRGRAPRPVGAAVCGARRHLRAPRAGKAAPG